jgi:hypothetical protein
VWPAGTVTSVAVQVAPALKPVTVNTAGEPSEAGLGVASGVPLVQVSETLTVAALSGTKSLLTVKVAEVCVFVIVHEGVPPLVIVTFWQEASFFVYPAGAAPSLAEQVAPALKPVTVNTAGEPSEAFVGEVATDPLVHVSETLTVAALFGMKSLLTVKVAEVCVFVIVQEAGPASMATFWQPLSSFVYPAGGGPSVAEQLAPALNPLMVKTAGEPSEAGLGEASGVPLVQVTETLTLPGSLGTKSLLTVNVSERVFTIVHEAEPPALIATFWQGASFFV